MDGLRRDGSRLDALALGVAVVVLVGSLVPVPPVEASTVTALVQLPLTGGEESIAAPLGVGVDKWVHALAYAVLGGLAAMSRRPRTLALAAVVLAVAAFGAGVEVAQAFVPGRTASGADAVANTVGAAVGVAGWCLLVRRRDEASRRSR